MSAFHARILASDTLFFDGDCEFMVVPCTAQWGSSPTTAI